MAAGEVEGEYATMGRHVPVDKTDGIRSIFSQETDVEPMERLWRRSWLLKENIIIDNK